MTNRLRLVRGCLASLDRRFVMLMDGHIKHADYMRHYIVVSRQIARLSNLTIREAQRFILRYHTSPLYFNKK